MNLSYFKICMYLNVYFEFKSVGGGGNGTLRQLYYLFLKPFSVGEVFYMSKYTYIDFKNKHTCIPVADSF